MVPEGIKYLDFSLKKNSIQKAIKDVLKIKIIYLRLRFLDEYTNSSKSKLLIKVGTNAILICLIMKH